jgi:hypothetical protein
MPFLHTGRISDAASGGGRGWLWTRMTLPDALAHALLLALLILCLAACIYLQPLSACIYSQPASESF